MGRHLLQGKEFSPEALLAKPPSVEEKKYANIVREFLGTHLTQILGVNCYCASSASTYWAYKCLVERYSLLEHMPFRVDATLSVPLRETYCAYGRQAFGNSEFVVQLELDTK